MEHKHKQLQWEDLPEVLSQLLSNGGTMPLLITGDSMYPFLKSERDTVYLSAITGPIRSGDMIFYRRQGGAWVLHRVVAIRDDSLCMLGDRQITPEWGVPVSSAAAIVTAVRRNGKMLRAGHPVWFFFAKIWPKLILLRPYLIKLYTMFNR